MKAFLIRHSEPNQFDHAPYGTLCEIASTKELFIQKSKDESNPKWVQIERKSRIHQNDASEMEYDMKPN